MSAEYEMWVLRGLSGQLWLFDFEPDYSRSFSDYDKAHSLQLDERLFPTLAPGAKRRVKLVIDQE